MKVRCMMSLALLACCSLALAQETKKPAAPKKAPAAEKKTATPAGPPMMAKPAPEMQKIKFLNGRWTVSGKFEANEMMPSGGTETGTTEFHPVAGGMAVVQNYKSNSGFAGHSVTWWDAKDKVYKTLWCDSMSSCQSISTGKWEGDKLVFTGDVLAMGKKMTVKDTFSDIKPDGFTFSEDAASEGGPMKPSMMLKYSKAAGKAAAAGAPPAAPK
jgi:hypothetical protein